MVIIARWKQGRALIGATVPLAEGCTSEPIDAGVGAVVLPRSPLLILHGYEDEATAGSEANLGAIVHLVVSHITVATYLIIPTPVVVPAAVTVVGVGVALTNETSTASEA